MHDGAIFRLTFNFGFPRRSFYMSKNRNYFSALILAQIGCLLISLFLFIIIWFFVTLFLNFLFYLGGTDSGWFRQIFIELMAPAFAAYIGLSIGLSYLRRSTPKFIFLSFTIVMLISVGIYLGFVGALREGAGISVNSYLWGAANIVAGILGAFKAAKDAGLKL